MDGQTHGAVYKGTSRSTELTVQNNAVLFVERLHAILGSVDNGAWAFPAEDILSIFRRRLLIDLIADHLRTHTQLVSNIPVMVPTIEGSFVTVQPIDVTATE